MRAVSRRIHPWERRAGEDWTILCIITHDYTSLIDNHEYYYQNLHALTGVDLNSSCVHLFFAYRCARMGEYWYGVQRIWGGRARLLSIYGPLTNQAIRIQQPLPQ